MRLKSYNLGEREDVGENSRQSRERKRYRIKKKRVYITKKGEVHSLREKKIRARDDFTEKRDRQRREELVGEKRRKRNYR